MNSPYVLHLLTTVHPLTFTCRSSRTRGSLVTSVLNSAYAPHSSGKYKPPWLSLAPLHPLGQSVVATLDVSAFDRVVDELFAPDLSNVSEGEDSNRQYSTQSLV
jgi:hypothetical protein